MEPSWSHFQIFSLLNEINNFCDKIAFLDGSMLFPVFGSFMLTCYMEPNWFQFADFEPAWWSNLFLEQKYIF